MVDLYSHLVKLTWELTFLRAYYSASYRAIHKTTTVIEHTSSMLLFIKQVKFKTQNKGSWAIINMQLFTIRSSRISNKSYKRIK